MVDTCKACGAELHEGDTFCTACGTPIESANPEPIEEKKPKKGKNTGTAAQSEAVAAETVAAPDEPATSTSATAAIDPADPVLAPAVVSNAPDVASAQNPADIRPPRNSMYTPISTAGFFGIFLLMLIPLVNLVFLIAWACGACKKINKRNFARAVLLFLAFLLVVGIVVALLWKPYIGPFVTDLWYYIS